MEEYLNRGFVGIGSAIQFRIFADNRAGVDPGIYVNASWPDLNHKVHGNKIFDKWDRQLNARKIAWF